MKRVFSAGGIVVRDFDGEKKVLVTQHSGHHGWDFPKGHVEKGEKSVDAAIREVEEETGVKAEVVEKVGDTKYFYDEEKEKVFKTVVYFLMKYVEEGEATTAWEVSAKEWLPVDEVEDKLTFGDSKKLFSEVKSRI
ncbi:MAG: NUDIX domain-containing protein [Candidatus Curtissbacteria bacterium]|nr:NUDIX domain-containing protein [Candidatus Curtissbacteria bacterium]